MLTFLVYLWLKLDSVLNGILTITAVYVFAMALFAFINSFFLSSYHEKYAKETYKRASERWNNFAKNLKKRLIICAIIFLIIGAIPNSNQVAVLAATHYTQELVQSEEGQKIVQLVRKKAASYLDEQLKELDEGVVNKTQEVVDSVKK